MSVLVIGNNEYELPTSLSCGKWVTLSKIGISNPKMFVSIAFDIPVKDTELLSEGNLELAGAMIANLMFPTDTPTWKLLDFTKLTLGQFIDLEMCVDAGPTKLIELCKIIFPQNTIDEKTDIKRVYQGYQQYLKYRTMLYYNYKGLFDIDDENEEVVEVKQDKPRNNAHAWYDLVMVLCKEDFTKIEHVTSRPLAEAFNYLAWHKDKQKKLAYEAKKQRQKNELRRIA